MYIFVDRNNIEQNIELLSDFEQNIFITAFPDPDERESFTDDIIPRIRNCREDEPQTFCILALDDSQNILGGLVADWYHDCESLELIYIATAPDRRRAGIGSELLNTGIQRIRESINNTGQSIRHIFAEVDIPGHGKSPSSMNAVDRLTIWESWGGKRIPINYIQPSLGAGKEPVSNMMLLYLPTTGNSHTIDSKSLKNFLKSFYKGLHADGDDGLAQMLEDVDMMSKNGKIHLESLTESPAARISNAVITTHFQIKGKLGIDLPENCMEFNSFECDLMSYNNQKRRPFKTKFVKIFHNVTLVMPSFYQYTSEGITHYYKTATRELVSDISISISCPADINRINPIAHISIRPSASHTFSELDMIRLISAFGSKQEDYRKNSDIVFRINGSEYTSELLLMSLLHIPDKQMVVNLQEGISQFDITTIKPIPEAERFSKKDFFKSLEGLTPIKADKFNKIVCGLILGIFDYKRMNSAEVEDTLRPTVTCTDSVIILSRGHILKIEKMDKEDKMAMQRIMISPYLLTPSTALALNGIALEECETILTNILSNRFRLNITGPIYQCEIGLNLKYMENIFQYQSEQDIMKEGSRQRSMEDRFNRQSKRINLLKKRVQKSSDILIELFLGALTIVSITEVVAKGIEWTWISYVIIAILLSYELWRWYNVRKMIDLR